VQTAFNRPMPKDAIAPNDKLAAALERAGL
jgi:hypothetical protein